MSALDDADALVAELAALFHDCRIRSQQIALSRAYWQAVRVRDALRLTVAA